MALLAELKETGSEVRVATPSGSVPQDPVAVKSPSRRFPPQTVELGSSRRITIQLGVSFALLLSVMFGVAYWVSRQSAVSELILHGELANRAAKLQLVDQALQYSNANNRITMQALALKSASPELLTLRVGNTQKITERIAALEAQCESERERHLLRAVKQTRRRYFDLRQRALELGLQEKKPELADVVMVQEATPALVAYHAAWQEFAVFELEQITQAAEQNAARHIRIRHVGLALQCLAAFLAVTIALTVTGTISRDLRLRVRMQAKLSTLNAELEQRVLNRTEELARAEQQLREALAEAHSYAQEIEAVNELAKLLQSCLTLEEARQQAARMLEKFFPAGAVLLLNSSRNLLEVAFSWGPASSGQGPFALESCWGLRKGQPHMAGPHCHNPICSHCGEMTAGCHLCIPMVAQGDSLGVLSIDDPSFCGYPPMSSRRERKLKLASTLAEQISLAFANLTLRETLKYQSVRDPLTGLFNRRHMEEGLERELLRAARKGTPVAVLMIDIDDFKRFNDTCGHEAGDLVLREFGLLLRLQIRGGDVACRYGGEEFLLIMSETDAEPARQRAESLRERLAALPIRYRGQTLRPLTISVGIAAFPANASSREQLISAADGALYRAKHEGRDRVVVAE